MLSLASVRLKPDWGRVIFIPPAEAGGYSRALELKLEAIQGPADEDLGNVRVGCIKSLFMALRTKLYLDSDIFLLILLRKINKKMSLSKEYFVAEGG